jgi:predicted MPP superfamily phosphohydrolase
MVNMIEKLNPDIIFLAGDVIDEDTDPFIKQNMAAALLRLRAKYGIYGVLGNHEYIGGMTDKAAAVLESTGIKVLRDSYVKIGENIVIAGRDDMSHSYLSQKQRKTLNSMLEGVDKSLPIILLNHQPRELEESRSAGVDLQLSGHTHSGQLFPIHLITEKIYEDDWGHLSKGSLQLIVSSGFGTWGPPIRTGNRPEIVDIHISFSKE